MSRKFKRRSALVATAALGGIASAGAALAQQPPASTGMLEEIVVTAQKRSENLQEVPVAITALTDQTRELLGIKSVQDMTDFTPSLVYYNNLDRMTLRGVGRLTNNAGTEPGVATYIDGFYLSSNVLIGVSDLFNQRVEVLRGPQGTLYGRNSIGGAINTISRRPTDEWSGEVRTTVANYDRTVAEGTLSGPIGGSWKFRLTANETDQHGGYFHNIGTAPDEGGVANDHFIDLQVQGTMGPVDAWFKYFKYQIRGTDRLNNSQAPYDNTTRLAFGLAPSALYNGTGVSALQQYTVQNPGITDPRALNTSTSLSLHYHRDDLWIAHLSWHMDGVDLNYVGGYYRYEFQLRGDSDNASRPPYQYTPPAPGAQPVTVFTDLLFSNDEYHNYYSNELNLTSTGNGPFQWIVGLYQFNEHFFYPFSISSPHQTQLYNPISPITFAPVAANPNGDIIYEDGTIHNESKAAYAQIDWKFTDQWKLTAGARYTDDDKNGIATQRYISWDPNQGNVSFDISSFAVPSAGFPAGTTPLVMNVSKTTKAVSGVLGTEWTPATNTLVYFKYSRGSKAGSLNLGGISYVNPASTTVDPEKLDAFEVGLKQQMGTLQINAAAYYYDYKNAQIPLSVQDPNATNATAFVSQFVNLGKIRTIGAELEGIWQPMDALTLILNYSYINAIIKDAPCFSDALDPTASQPGAIRCAAGPAPAPGGVQTYSQSPVGSHMLGSPPNKISASASYKFDFEPGSLSFTVTDSWRDRQYSSILDRPYLQTPSYNLIGGRIVWTDTNHTYNVIGYVANAFDKLAADNVGANPAPGGGFDQLFGYLPPRTYGVEVQYRFGAGK